MPGEIRDVEISYDVHIHRQGHTTQFTPVKNFPQTGGFGPCLVTADAIDEVHKLAIRTRLNGVIATGTPGGVGFTRDPHIYLKPGDEVAGWY